MFAHNSARSFHPSSRWLVRIGLVMGLAFAVSGCESMEKLNPFQEKETKLTGDRQAVFPEGVPGVNYDAARAQPTNSNASLDVLPPAAGTSGR